MIDVATTPQPPVDATGTWRIRFAAMGGSGEVVLAAAGAAQARRWADAAIAEVLRIEHKYSPIVATTETKMPARAAPDTRKDRPRIRIDVNL